ncbi:hypothetical protein DdX_20763 [Ditylenchus destructor]|uniref:Uncharacterized protein n=1 Tax=Ditylenchus destructor TaxID=166010 RepID=A0AAD4MIA3_9BILA|nr:hypothetical protein DdX_20763 [Ditylenchus destructor]
MTLAFRNQLSQAANQMRTLLATAPPDWTAAEDASAALSLLALEEEIAVNTEHSDALLNEAARFEEGQRLFLSAFGKLPSGSKDAEQKTYDDLLNEIRLDELQAECRQMSAQSLVAFAPTSARSRNCAPKSHKLAPQPMSHLTTIAAATREYYATSSNRTNR